MLDVPASLLEEIAGFAELDDLAIGRDALDYLMQNFDPSFRRTLTRVMI